jgi:hypothetical protein
MTMRVSMAAIGMVSVFATAAPAFAAVTQYECRFDQDRAQGGGWIPEMLILTEDEGTGEIVVFDPVIKHFIGTPIEARLSDRTKARSTYKWEIETRNKGQSTRMVYTLSYRSSGNRATMSALPGGYDNKWRAEGTCKVSKG